MLLKLTILLVALLVTAASSAAVVAPGSIIDLTADYNKTSSLATWEEKAVAEVSGTDRPICLTPSPSEEYLETMQQALVASNLDKSTADQAARNITVDLYIHWVMTSHSDSVKNESAIRAAMVDQFSLLQDTYQPYGINFKPIMFNMVVNDTWAQAGDQLAMKYRLRQGTYRTLNIYVINNFASSPGALGDCYMPLRPNEMKSVDNFFLDGCRVILSNLPPQGTGGAAVHEVGHWLGLMHTFGGGCSDPNDYIDDTPAEKEPNFECKVRDSCPAMPGNDPIHNYMDYSPDSCKTEFTPGQVDRMFAMWDLCRANR